MLLVLARGHLLNERLNEQPGHRLEWPARAEGVAPTCEWLVHSAQHTDGCTDSPASSQSRAGQLPEASLLGSQTPPSWCLSTCCPLCTPLCPALV